MEDLMKLRESIDEIDNEIVRLYKERMEISKQRRWGVSKSPFCRIRQTFRR